LLAAACNAGSRKNCEKLAEDKSEISINQKSLNKSIGACAKTFPAAQKKKAISPGRNSVEFLL
jgi:hypothetical protein